MQYFSIEVEGNIATVDFETNQHASLVVGIYDEAGTKLIASGTVDVEPGDRKAKVWIETGEMPQYFYLRGFLVDFESFEPYCTAYDSPNYTKEMQDFLAKTTDDFQGQEILNFDDDKTNNFAVYNKETVVISEKDGVNDVVKADIEKEIYVFENVNEEITSLEKGDFLSYEYDDKTVLILKVDKLQIDGTKVTITGEDVSMEEVFDYVKIDSEGTIEEAEIDDSYCDDGVSFEGLTKDEEPTARAGIEAEDSRSASFKIKKDFGENNRIEAGVDLGLTFSAKLYISLTYQYIELKFDYSLKGSIAFQVGGSPLDIELKFAQFRFMPIPAINVKVVPAFVGEASATIEFNPELKGTIGVRASSDNGIKNLTSSPEFSPEVKGEIDVFVGIKIEPSVNIISPKIAEVSLNAKAGGTAFAEQIGGKEDASTYTHECESCFDGDIGFKAGIGVGLELLSLLEFGLDKDISVKIWDFYWSVTFGEFGFTTCPHMMYRTDVKVKDPNHLPVKDAVVNEEYVTDNSGKAILYFPSGKQTIKVETEGESVSKKIVIREEARKITVKLKKAKPVERKIVDFVAKGQSNAAVLEDKSLWTWGYNYWGNLGNGAAFKTDGSLWGWGNIVGMDENYGYVPRKMCDGAKAVIEGNLSYGVLMKNGNLWMWGDNDCGQLGDGTTENKTVPTKIMEDVQDVALSAQNTAVIKSDGSLWMWGSNAYGSLGQESDSVNITIPVQIMEDVRFLSEKVDAAIKEDDTLWTWGINTRGNLGIGSDELCIYTPALAIDNVVLVARSSQHSGAVTRDGRLLMWGGNPNRAELGLGEDSLIAYSATPIDITGNFDDENILEKSRTRTLSEETAEEESEELPIVKADSVTVGEDGVTTAVFNQLDTSKLYNYYVMKSIEGEENFQSSNLLYIGQSEVLEDGSMSVSYIPKEDTEDVIIFAAGMPKPETGGIPEEPEKPELESISLNRTEPFAMEKGATEPLTVEGTPEGALEGKTLKWTSSDEKVATVTDGIVNAIGAGTTVITVEADGKTASVKVTVHVPMTAISLDKKEIEIETGKSDSITVTFEPQDTTDDKTLTCKLDNPEIVKCEIKENEIQITGTKEGETILTVTGANGVTAECVVRVVKADAEPGTDEDGKGEEDTSVKPSEDDNKPSQNGADDKPTPNQGQDGQQSNLTQENSNAEDEEPVHSEAVRTGDSANIAVSVVFILISAVLIGGAGMKKLQRQRKR